MNEFTFEEAAYERWLDELQAGQTVSAVQLLTLLEGEEEEVWEQTLSQLEQLRVQLDVSALPKSYGSGESALRLRREEQLAGKPGFEKELEDTDPLRLYLQELAGLPKVSDVQTLAQQLPNGAAADKLTSGLLHRVAELAKGYTGLGVLLLDLIQEGSMGLWKAVQTYCGGSFAQQADAAIRFSMASAVVLQARSGDVGQKLRRSMEDYRAVDERLLCDLGRNPTTEEIAAQMHITPEEAAQIGKFLEDARRMQQSKPAPEEPEDDPEEQQSVENTALFQSRQRILDLLSQLSEADARLLTLRFGLEGGLPLSPEDAGRQLGLTPEEVVSREAAALMQLRNSEE